MARRAVSLNTVCKLGTIAYNKAFSSRDFYEYAGTPEDLRALVNRGVVRRVSGGDYYPTAKGWKAVDRACNLQARRR